MQNPFIATIIEFGGNFAPRGWAFCNGQLMPISGNDALFSLLGTTYGGDGRTTFGLPDLRGRAAMHAGNGPGLTPRSLGQKGGTETNVLNSTQIPSHTHTGNLHVSSANATQGAATQGSSIAAPGVLSGRTFTPTEGFNAAAPDITMNGSSVATGNTGSSSSINNIEPFQVVNYIIALVGVYPSRS
ncbi:MAG: tail fiber protein [Gilvibacter sp.]